MFVINTATLRSPRTHACLPRCLFLEVPFSVLYLSLCVVLSSCPSNSVKLELQSPSSTLVFSWQLSVSLSTLSPKVYDGSPSSAQVWLDSVSLQRGESTQTAVGHRERGRGGPECGAQKQKGQRLWAAGEGGRSRVRGTWVCEEEGMGEAMAGGRTFAEPACSAHAIPGL